MTAAQTGGERACLTAFLDYLRREVVLKTSGLSEAAARRSLVPSLTTPAGILKHLAVVERNWFQAVLLQRPPQELGIDWTDPDRTWRLSEADTLDALVQDYEKACAESREAAERFALDDTAQHSAHGAFSLRWILVHMIEETGRHAGHADILREQIEAAD